eukprot:Pgem_evm1s17126
MSELVQYNKDHYPDGLNNNFETWDKEKLAGAFAEKGGKFEDPELRDIARNFSMIETMLEELMSEAIKERK